MEKPDLEDKERSLDDWVRQADAHLAEIERGEFDGIASTCASESRDRDADLAESSGLEPHFWTCERQKWEAWCRWWYAKKMYSLGWECGKLHEEASLRLTVRCYDEAIRLGATLPIEQSEGYRYDLAGAWHNRGRALLSQNTSASLAEAVRSYDEAIRLRASLPIEHNDKDRNWLAWDWNNRGNALRQQNTSASLTEAVTSYDEAIRLRASLPIDQSHEYRNDLATTWTNRGHALRSQNSVASLAEAIRSYNEAIRLRASLPINENDQYRIDLAWEWMHRNNVLLDQNTAASTAEAEKSVDEAFRLLCSLPVDQSQQNRNVLAWAWIKRGNTLHQQNTAASLAEAVKSYDEAIRLCSFLPIDQSDDYRLLLGRAWTHRGNSLRSQHTHVSFVEAIKSYDEAIRLGASLPIDQSDQYRNDLASSWNNRGNALHTQNATNSLAEAVKSYDEAIRLRASLPIDQSDQYRNDLASSWNNRGNALQRQNGNTNIDDAFKSYERAVELCRGSSLNFLPRVRTELLSRTGACLVLTKLAERQKLLLHTALERACDLADGGLALARHHFLQGVHFHLGLTSELFRNGALAYAEHQPHFLAEYLLEMLDPDSPGSVPESREMHATALEVIPIALNQLRPQAMADFSRIAVVRRHIDELEAAGRRLAEIRDLYFAATPEATRLRAAFHERAGDLKGARECWEKYCRAQPRDLRGYLALARWDLEHGNANQADGSLEKAILSIPEFLSLHIEESRQAARDLARELATILGTFIATGDLPASEGSGKKPWTAAELAARFASARQRLQAMLDRWSGKKLLQPLHEGLRAALNRLDETHTALAAESDSRWMERLAADRERCRQLLEIQSEVVFGLFSRTLGYAEDALRELGREMAAVLAAELDRPEPADKGTLRERLAKMAAHALDKILGETAEAEAGDEARAAIEELLGDTIPLLSDRSRKHLLFAERFRRESPDLAAFVGTAYGFVLEHELGEPVFLNLRDRLRDARGRTAPVVPYDEDDYLEKRVGPFLNGKRQHLMLGEMIGCFGKSVLAGGGRGRPVFDEVRSHVEDGFREPQQIVGLSATEAKRQKTSLDTVLEVRNNSAHPNDAALLTAERLLAARSALAGPDGFLPVFLRARFGKLSDIPVG